MDEDRDEDKPKVINIGNARLQRFASQFKSADDCFEAMLKLSPRERDVLRLRLGIKDGRPRSVKEIAELYGVTSRRVKSLEKTALQKLFPQ